MRPAIGVALKHAENAINSFITYNKSNSAYGMTDDQSTGPMKDASYSSIIMKKLKSKKSHWNLQKWWFDECHRVKKHAVIHRFYHFIPSFIAMDDASKQILPFRIWIDLKDCLICISSARIFTHFKYTFHSVHFTTQIQTHEPKHCNNGKAKTHTKCCNIL